MIFYLWCSSWIFHGSFKNSSGLVCIRAAIITTIFDRLPIISKAPLQTGSMLRAWLQPNWAVICTMWTCEERWGESYDGLMPLLSGLVSLHHSTKRTVSRLRLGEKQPLCCISARTGIREVGGVQNAGLGYRISTFANPRRAIMDANGITCPTIT